MPDVPPKDRAARTWWRDGVLYQIYPRSYFDTNADGVGDLRGITARLDHLQWLGVEGIWLDPVMPSPNADWGYDVADYCAVDPEPFEVVQARQDPAQVADPVAVRVRERARVDLVQDAVAPPRRSQCAPPGHGGAAYALAT